MASWKIRSANGTESEYFPIQLVYSYAILSFSCLSFTVMYGGLPTTAW